MHPHNKVHPDTRDGVMAMLSTNFDAPDCGWAKCEYQPDPMVQGVWLVTAKSGGQCIAYLAGYPDPNGNLRPHNDAEFTWEGW